MSASSPLKSEISPSELIMKAYRLAAEPAAHDPEPWWLRGVAQRIGERIEKHSFSTDSDKSSVCSIVLHCSSKAGHSLHEYYSAHMTPAQDIRRRLSKRYLNEYEPEMGKLLSGLPGPFEYMETRRLYAGTDRGHISTLESTWTNLSNFVREDLELRRSYGQLVCRHAAYEKADHALGVNSYFVGSDYCVRTETRANNFIRLGFFILAVIIASILTLYLATATDLATALVPGLMIFFAGLYIVFRSSAAEDVLRESKVDKIRPLVALENAIAASTSDVDLERCCGMARTIFNNGHVEARYVENVLTALRGAPE